MKNLLLFILFSQLLFSQIKKESNANDIYASTEKLIANPTIDNIKLLQNFEKTITTTKDKNEQIAIVYLNCNLGYYQNQLGATQNAISSYEKAWQIFNKNQLKGYDIIEFCLKPLGNLYTKISDYDNAENTIKQYYYIAENSKNTTQIYAAILNLSVVYQNTGRIEQAINIIKNALINDKLSTNQKGILLNNLGNNYYLRIKNLQQERNDFENAEQSFLQSINLLKNDRTQAETRSNAYRNLAKLYFQIDDVKATLYFDKATAEINTLKHLPIREKAQFYFEKASLAYKNGKIAEAKATIISVFKLLIPNYSSATEVLPKTNSLYAETTLLDALDLQAQIYLAENQPKKSIESYALCFHIEELFQSLMIYENSKIITEIRNRNRIEKCIDIYYSLYKKEKKTIYLEQAFLLSENNKSLVLKQAISNFKTLNKETKLIVQQFQNWNNILLKEQQKQDLADISKINNAIKKQQELMLLLKSKLSNKTNINSNFIQISNLYSKLETDNATLVSYVFGNEKCFVFTLENHKIMLDYFWNNHTATPQIMSFLDFFSDSNKINNNPKEFNQQGNLIYNLLKLPIKNKNKNLLIIPDGILSFLPFETLITKETSTTNFSKMNYLLNDFTVGYSTSASVYLNSVSTKSKNQSVLGVFPVFKNTPLELAYSVKEMEAIEKNFKGKYLAREEATFSNFENFAPNYTILHLSTHATAGDIDTPAEIKFYDKNVLYSELYNLKINPDLVVLSACETGLGKLYKSEGAMSVSRGFQMAGAQNLLFSLWKVNDFTTSVFMDKFYENIKNGNSYFESNHKAKLDFLNDTSISNSKKSPFYWGAFAYYGSFKNESTNFYFLWISIVGSLLILVLIWKFYIIPSKLKSSKR